MGMALEVAIALVKKAQDLDTHLMHDGYDNAPGGGNYVYADVVRTDELLPILDEIIKALEAAK